MVELEEVIRIRTLLENERIDQCLAVAVRIGLRAFPELVGGLKVDKYGEVHNDPSNDVVLIAQRSLLISSVAALEESQEIFAASAPLYTLGANVNNPIFDYGRSDAAAAFVTIHTVADAAGSSKGDLVIASDFTAAAAREGAQLDDGRAWDEMQFDLGYVRSEIPAKSILSRHLWALIPQNPDNWSVAKELLKNDTVDQSFWIDWYERFIDGQPQNWKMLEEIALIDPKDWDQGAEHVNGLIAEIQARYAVKESVSEAQIVLNDARPANAQMGHNNPPDDIEDIPYTKEDEELIARVLGELKHASDEPDPDVSKLGSNIAELRVVFAKIGKWFAKKLDMAVNVIITTLVTGGTITVLPEFQAWLLSLWAKLQPVIETVTNWIPLIG